MAKKLFGIRRRFVFWSLGVYALLAMVLVAFSIVAGATFAAGVPSTFIWVGCVAALLIVTSITTLLVLRTVTEPVAALTETVRRVEKGNYGAVASRRFDDEVGQLVVAFNALSAHIAASENMKTDFVASVSHELRTPLTAITGWGETLIVDEGLSAETRRGIEIILTESRRLSKLVEELLEFTRMEDGRFTLNIKQISLDKELEETIFTYREHLRRDGIELLYTPADGTLPEVSADPERLRQVFYNILDNAAKHGGDGGKIAVSVALDGSFVRVDVRDWGSGIPADELPHVKTKFYKGQNAKQRGSGIGLSVCDEIVTYHAGQLEIKNADDGVMVSVKLPIGID